MPSTPFRLRKAGAFALMFSVFLIPGCKEKKDFTIVSDLELGETITNHPTVLSLRKAVKGIGVTFDFKDASIEKEADIIQLINTKKIDIGIVKNDVEMGSGFNNVRTLLPLFPDVLLILSRGDSTSSIENLFTHSKAAMILDKEEERGVIERFLKKNDTSSTNRHQLISAPSTLLTQTALPKH
jgi:hypothetical protein